MAGAGFPKENGGAARRREGLGAWLAVTAIHGKTNGGILTLPAGTALEQHSFGLQVPGDSTLGLPCRGSQDTTSVGKYRTELLWELNRIIL